MRKPMLTNKVLRGLRVLSRLYLDVHFNGHPPTAQEADDANRAREWIAAMAEWWRSTHKGVKL